MRQGILVVVLFIALPAAGQISLPRLPGVGGEIKIPGLDQMLREKPPLTTSFDDAITGVRYWDDFEPLTDVAMTEMPRGQGNAFLLAPGGYEIVLESYCLHAGTYGPGRGEGYLYAPLKGELAGVIRDVLLRSADFPDIPQPQIQTLIWGIEARTKISEMPEEIRNVAHKLLTPQQIDRLNGGALGKIPPELMQRAFAKLPSAVRQVMEARARIRNMLSGLQPDFGELERIAVLAGDPPEESERGENVPLSRWSYQPGGFFVRYRPDTYRRTRVQVYIPPPVTLEKDGQGRIVAVSDEAGRRLELAYDDTQAEPLRIEKDAALRGYAWARVRFVWTDSEAPEAGATWELEGRGWTFVGIPSGKGRPNGDTGQFSDVRARYQETCQHYRELTTLAKNVQKVGTQPLSAEATTAVVGEMMDLAHCYAGLRACVQDVPQEQAWTRYVAELLREAWGAALVHIGEGGATPPARRARGAGLPFGSKDWWLGLGSLEGQRLAWAGRQPDATTLFWAAWGAGGSRGLRRFDPSGGAATPASRGRQRLGVSPRPSSDQEDVGAPSPGRKLRPFKPLEPEEEEESGPRQSDKEVLNRAEKSVGWISTGMDVVSLVTGGPAEFVRDKVGFGVRDAGVESYFDWLFETARKISRELGGDPPRSDYDQLATAEPLPAAGHVPQWGETVPPARAAALTALYESLLDLVSKLRAGQITRDRLGGAIRDGNDEAIERQATALLHWKHAGGEAMIVTAQKLKALLEELKAEGIHESLATPEAFRAYQERLRQQGFSREEREAAQLLGLSDAEIEAARQRRLAVDPEEVSGNLLAWAEEAARGLRRLGERWRRLPQP